MNLQKPGGLFALSIGCGKHSQKHSHHTSTLNDYPSFLGTNTISFRTCSNFYKVINGQGIDYTCSMSVPSGLTHGSSPASAPQADMPFWSFRLLLKQQLQLPRHHDLRLILADGTLLTEKHDSTPLFILLGLDPVADKLFWSRARIIAAMAEINVNRCSE